MLVFSLKLMTLRKTTIDEIVKYNQQSNQTSDNKSNTKKNISNPRKQNKNFSRNNKKFNRHSGKRIRYP